MVEVKAALDQIRQVGDRACRPKPVHSQPSIAVLPFANMSGDKEQEYFSDGLAEEIINALVKIPGLKVIARTSAFAFKGQNTDIRKIAETLGVANILEGSVRRSGNRIRVTAQLITAADGSHLWSERYDREMADVFAVQDEISAAIAGALHAKLSPQPAAKPRYTPKLPAYEALLKARHFHWKVTPESMEQAKEFYEQAIALDPQYALAQALYADYLGGRATMGHDARARGHAGCPRHGATGVGTGPFAPGGARYPVSLSPLATITTGKRPHAGSHWRRPDDTASPWCHFVPAGWLTFWHRAGRRKLSSKCERAVQGDPLHLTIRSAGGHASARPADMRRRRSTSVRSMDLDPNFFIGPTSTSLRLYAGAPNV